MSVLAPASICCPVCAQRLSTLWIFGEEEAVRCARCASTVHVLPFRLLSEPDERPVDFGARAQEGEATCFFHPGKRAERPCDRCGRFLCTLCDLPFGQRHLCPACLEVAGQQARPVELVTRRLSWPHFALTLGIWPLIFFPFWFLYFITGPAAVGAALYGWRQPGSLVPRWRVLPLLGATLLGLLQIGLITLFFYGIWRAQTHA